MKLILPSIILAMLFAVSPLTAGGLKMATFVCDATPPLGEPMIWATPLQKVVTPLLAKGIVLEDGTNRFVLCAFDWCLICNDSETRFRTTIATAVGTSPDRVSVHSLHQHAAPYADEAAHRLLDSAPHPLPHLSEKFLLELNRRLADAAAGAASHLGQFDRIGIGEAPVERVASARRIHDGKGRLLIRYSTGATDKAMADAPEGDIDPMLKTITFARGDKPLARLHFYATHPQTFCCDGRASADFVGEAREELEKSEGIPEIYFTGCAGDVTVGKYNDGSAAAYEGLKQRIGDGLRAAIAATRYESASNILWKTDSVLMPLREDKAKVIGESRAWLNDVKQSDTLRVFKGAMRLSFVERVERPVGLCALRLGNVWVVNLPGEPMLAFQRFTQGLRSKDFVAVAGYADCGTSYLCTEEAIREGGYEPSASNAGPGSERVLRDAIRRILADDSKTISKNFSPN